MVYEQGLTVDSIESSVEQTSVYVSQGTENLRLAGSYKVLVFSKKIKFLFKFYVSYRTNYAKRKWYCWGF